MELSVVIPCYNEEECIEEVVSSWIEEIGKQVSDYELIVVNDGSKDGTLDILNRLATKFSRLKVITQVNQGHGPALLNAYRHAQGEWIFHTDSDNQFVPADFWSLWSLRSRSTYILGFRLNRQDPPHRLVLTRLLRFLVRILTGAPIRDINIPYKLIHRDILLPLLDAIPADTFAPSVLLAIGAHRMRAQIEQVGVRHLPRITGQTVLKPWKLTKSCARALRQTLSFYFQFRPAQ